MPTPRANPMSLDIRYPIGMMFTLIGLLLAGSGLVAGGSVSIAGLNLGVNVNLVWGAVLFLFGVLMWGSAIRSASKSAGGN
jgi:hypothetical protein